MATIEKRIASSGTVSWRARVRKTGYPVRTKTFARKTDATTWARQLEGDIDRGNSIPDQQTAKRTLAEAIDLYLSDVLPYKARNKDKKNVTQRLNWWKDEIGSYAMRKIDKGTIARCIGKLCKGKRATSTVNRYKAACSVIYSTAKNEWGWVNVSPFDTISNLSEPKPRTRFLSEDERSALLKACKASDSKYLYLVVVAKRPS